MEKTKGDFLEDVTLTPQEDDFNAQRMRMGMKAKKEENLTPHSRLNLYPLFPPARRPFPNNYEATQPYSAFETHSQIQALPQQKMTCNCALLV